VTTISSTKYTKENSKMNQDGFNADRKGNLLQNLPRQASWTQFNFCPGRHVIAFQRESCLLIDQSMRYSLFLHIYPSNLLWHRWPQPSPTQQRIRAGSLSPHRIRASHIRRRLGETRAALRRLSLVLHHYGPMWVKPLASAVVVAPVKTRTLQQRLSAKQICFTKTTSLSGIQSKAGTKWSLISILMLQWEYKQKSI